MPVKGAEGERQKQKSVTLLHLLGPHWKTLLVGMFAVTAETAASLLEPWPLKIVLDSVLRTKKVPAWLTQVIVATVGQDRLAILQFAAFAVVLIAIIGALGTYVEKQTITAVGQRILHELRRTFYWHVQRLSMSYHDNKRTGDVISTVTTDIDAVQSAMTSGVLDALYYSLTLA